ncbi:glycosyltransferase family 4 protein [Paraburkholderia saeva]|uniref:D-inositol-3-phosphate glycosyltransferase n=1 Tax=Paraburkholderia saeva TaxID=2777537 RepID=A0A9N8WZP1_9BURK|nr:glycosyltransferase family 1 protein [Paraburkholderia saeva]CAG4887786.1 D-inositol-3-phosphate glycosyltransferase [Paraburkholderia saeva]
MSKPPLRVAVDLTPVLPGGENGGAKIFVLDLLRQLAEMAPETQFILLTQAASHDELAALDRSNMQRTMVIGPVAANSARPRLKRLAARVSPRIPARARRVLSRIGYRLNTRLKRRGAAALLRGLGVDLLFCPFTAPTYFEPGIPTVCTIYDLQYKTYPEFFAPEDVAHRGQTFLDASRRATALAAISDYSRQSAIVHGELDPSRIRTIHLRMARRIAPETSEGTQVLDRLGLAPHRYLIYPANFWKHKNHEMLLTAFGMACSGGGLATDIKLVCTGAPGARQEWLMNAARAMNLGDRITFPGYLPNSELSTLVSHCRGVVFPSLYEGFGLPVIEAMAAGVPVACSNTTSLPEVAAEAAILFDPRVPDQIADAMITLVGDEALRARLIHAGQQRANEFSDSRRMANEYWDLFLHALADSRQENLITGVEVDGWVGDRLKIQTAPLQGARSVEVEFMAPAWLPQPSISIQVFRDGNADGAPVKLKRATKTVVSLPMDHTGNCYELQLTPTFVPARCGIGSDQRQLSVMLQRCSILGDRSSQIQLYPEKASV